MKGNKIREKLNKFGNKVAALLWACDILILGMIIGVTTASGKDGE